MRCFSESLQLNKSDASFQRVWGTKEQKDLFEAKFAVRTEALDKQKQATTSQAVFEAEQLVKRAIEELPVRSQLDGEQGDGKKGD